MTLGRRALRIILPVVLVSNLLVALTIYWIERHNIEQAELAHLSRQMERLKGLFEEDLEFARNLVFLLRAGDGVRAFVREKDESLRATAVGVSVQDGIEFFSSGHNRFVSFAILTSDIDVSYYFERSDDPFAAIPQAQIDAAKTLMAGRGLSSNVVAMDDGKPLLIHTELIDRTTFSPAFATQRQAAIILQSAVRPERFQQMRAELERQYRSPLLIAPRIERDTGEVAVIEQLMPDLDMGIVLTEAYLSERLRPLQGILVAGCLVLSLASVGLLLSLIRRTITGPIAALDASVTDVVAGRRRSLDWVGGTGEIERLSTNIKTLHDQSLGTLAKVQEASLTDSLTGVGNRLLFTEAGTRMLDAARSAGEEICLLFIDLDNFKFVNDTFGHATGDAVLQHVTATVKHILASAGNDAPGNAPLLARLSGDEFAILLRGAAEVATGQDIATRIVDAFKDGLAVDSEVYPVGVSIGIARFPADAQSFTELVSCADRAMYQAKAAGKNGVVSYSRTFAESERRLEDIKMELQRLDPDEEFSLVYMPIVSRAGVVTKCEALLRWTSPRLGSVSPAEFIPIAEANALFSRIDRWVLPKAVGDLKALQEIFGPDIVLAVNISAAELSSRTIVDLAVAVAARHDAPASSIELEVTETFAIRIPAMARAVIQDLRDAGFKLSLDDFGSGHTSMKQILDFPVDTVKLDRELVGRIHDARGKLALSSIIDLCHSQNCLVVAEGVEDKFTQAALALAGCDLFQGFGIHKPAPLAELAAAFGGSRADGGNARSVAARSSRNDISR